MFYFLRLRNSFRFYPQHSISNRSTDDNEYIFFFSNARDYALLFAFEIEVRRFFFSFSFSISLNTLSSSIFSLKQVWLNLLSFGDYEGLFFPHSANVELIEMYHQKANAKRTHTKKPSAAYLSTDCILYIFRRNEKCLSGRITKANANITVNWWICELYKFNGISIKQPIWILFWSATNTLLPSITVKSTPKIKITLSAVCAIWVVEKWRCGGKRKEKMDALLCCSLVLFLACHFHGSHTHTHTYTLYKRFHHPLVCSYTLSLFSLFAYFSLSRPLPFISINETRTRGIFNNSVLHYFLPSHTTIRHSFHHRFVCIRLGFNIFPSK